MKKFNEIEIKDGYLLVVEMQERGTRKIKQFNMTVTHNQRDTLGCHSPSADHYWDIDCFDENGVFNGAQTASVLAIYGRTYNYLLLANSIEDRELLWKRKETKKMSVAEICEALGYDVEIVKEGQA